jgi:hypothetical protein
MDGAGARDDRDVDVDEVEDDTVRDRDGDVDANESRVVDKVNRHE